MATPVEQRDPSPGRSSGDDPQAPNPSVRETTEDQGPSEAQMKSLRAQGITDAESWRYANGRTARATLIGRWRRVRRLIQNTCGDLDERQAAGQRLTSDQTWLLENARLLHSLIPGISDALKSFRGLAVLGEGNAIVPRAYAIAAGFLRAGVLTQTETTLSRYLEGIQQVESLWMAELAVLRPMLEFALLEQIAGQTGTGLGQSETGKGVGTSGNTGPVEKAIQALRSISEVDWMAFFEQNSAVERVLRQDPSGVYPDMHQESRQIYRKVIEDLARQSLFSEEEVVRQAVLLAIHAKARAKRTELRSAGRRTHVGYYLMAGGSGALKRRLGYKPSFKQRIQDIILEWPEVYYFVGVELTTVALAFFLLYHLGIIIPFIAGLLLLIPASHAAIGMMNYLTGVLVPPRRIPRMDYSGGIPAECTTLVAVPCMLSSEAEVRRNVEALEIRYLGNRSPNLHFALLTDSPDARQPIDEQDGLVGTCSALIDQLNQKYARDDRGGFLHLHRHRVFNPSEGSWMGWERKRGKLMDLNSLLLGTHDSFPVKAGDLSVLPRVQYVITLDSDTKLPPGTAHQLVGALAHPLNRAVVDPRTNTVVEGYGILQPRVSVSIESSRNSRLSAIYSGQTGFDIYTHATSDVYQDLFGEGSFTGKGIYEVAVFQGVLGKRFPTNALLSHDLIEGAYARAGLVSDIVLIDDYPSHFSAYCRRLHRWVRGDWQIMRWLLPRVPDFYGRRVLNPLTFISRWKIFDNLRRSMNDVGLFLLLIMGWAILPGGPVYWTLVTLALLLTPTYCQLLFALFQAGSVRNWRGFLRQRANDLVTGHLHVFVMIVFLPHQALVMVDAIIRTLTRLTITHSNLLEWETAADAELGRKKTPVEVYLALTPWIAVAIGVALVGVRPASLFIASPILGLWMLADFFTIWVNRKPSDQKRQLTPEDERFLRLTGLRTWRYFREFSHAGNHWLIPDNVQEDPPVIASRLSPTNLGLLLNAHLAAHELGYLTLKQFAETVERTLATVKQLPRYNGHFFNWYDIQTMEPLEPRFVSTADSGNLAACLWTLKQSCLGLAGEPLLSRKLWQGIRDYTRLLAGLSRVPATPIEAGRIIRDLATGIEALGDDAIPWINSLARLGQRIQQIESELRDREKDSAEADIPFFRDLIWWLGETATHVQGVRELVDNLIPWALPEYSSLSGLTGPIDGITLASLLSAASQVNNRIANSTNDSGVAENERAAARALRRRLPGVLKNAAAISQVLRLIAEDSDRLVDEINFGFLYNSRKKLFSTGYNVSAGRLEPYCYDLLASEARIAVFIATAKGEVNYEAWFHLGRSFTSYFGERVLLSWSGTMFEYLMPALWMRSHQGTILDQTMHSAIRCQQEYAGKKNIPWGFSEAAFNERDTEGTYRYRAFGAPGLALDPHAPDNLVVSPYASFLALPIQADAVVRNLESMKKMGCLGRRGFYESCEFSPRTRSGSKEFEVVRCWMAHHQGMSLVALSNFLNGCSIQKWFHCEPKVMAAELFLHERVPLDVLVMPNPTVFPKRGRNPARTRPPNLRSAWRDAVEAVSIPARPTLPTTEGPAAALPPAVRKGSALPGPVSWLLLIRAFWKAMPSRRRG